MLLKFETDNEDIFKFPLSLRGNDEALNEDWYFNVVKLVDA